MSEKYQTLIELMNAWFGGAITTIIAAVTARMMWHANEARRKRRAFFGVELAWELPFAVCMAFIGEGVCYYLDAGPMLRPAIVGALVYIGPRGVEAMFFKLFAKHVGVSVNSGAEKE